MDGIEQRGMACPALDHADLTCHLGAHLLFEGLALLA
jgi:agmatinase